MVGLLSRRLSMWFAIAATVLLLAAYVRYSLFTSVLEANRDVVATRATLQQLENVLSTLKDAETGQRGFLLTGDANYLQPYDVARNRLDVGLAELEQQLADDPRDHRRLVELSEQIKDKLDELQRTIDLRRASGFAAAQFVVQEGRGKEVMDNIRLLSDRLSNSLQARLAEQEARGDRRERLNLTNFFGLALLNLFLLGMLYRVVRLEARQRRDTDKTIREQELRMRRMIDSNSMGVLFTDLSGTIHDANDAFLQLVGRAKTELGSRELAEYLTPLEFRERDRRAMQEIRQSGKCAPYEKEFLHRDGRRVPVLIGAARLEAEAEQVVAFVVDQSERRLAEEATSQLAAIVESSDDPIISQSLDGRIITWNRGAQRLYGYTAEEAIGRSLELLVPPQRQRELAKLLTELRAGQRTENFETVRVAKDGRPIDVMLTISPTKDQSGQVTGAAIIGHDITARRQAEKEREQLLSAERTARAEAERISHVKDEFLATLSHELRTPLNAILGWIHLLGTGSLSSAETAQGLDVIRRSARAQTQLIDDLLDMSRIISGKVRMDVQPVDLTSVIHQAIESVQPAADARNIRLIRVLDPGAGPVNGDPNRLQQIVWNLLSNAVKFTPKGGRVQITLGRIGSYVEIGVADNGQGIEPGFLPHVFERFRQADSSTTRQHAGLGLGLAIVRNLVELHGGTVRVSSSGEGQGSTFTVQLPLASVHQSRQADSRVHPTSSEERRDEGETRPLLRGIKVLVVDDEPDARELMRRLLEACQAQVVTAGSAAEALLAFQQVKPNVLLSDIGMPDVDGFELIRKVRQLTPQQGGNTPAAALTAFARSDDRRRALSSGFHMHLSKPVEPAELLAAVASLAGRNIDTSAAGKA